MFFFRDAQVLAPFVLSQTVRIPLPLNRLDLSSSQLQLCDIKENDGAMT
jgi:hypothetical protein